MRGLAEEQQAEERGRGRVLSEAAASSLTWSAPGAEQEEPGVELDGVRGVSGLRQAIPIFISDYVLSTYSTGAIMAVPAHDDRDWEFAKRSSAVRSSR